MIAPKIIKCNYCNSKTLLRFQVSEGIIPFDFYCPNCGVSFGGNVDFSNGGKIEVTNAEEVESDVKESDFYINISNDFLCRKVTKFVNTDEYIRNGFSPFIITTMMFKESENLIDANRRINNYINFVKWFKESIKPLYELFFSNKIDLLKEPLKHVSEHYIVDNELDAYMSLHQITVIGLSGIFEKQMLKSYTEIASNIINPKHSDQILKFINYLNKNNEFKTFYKKIYDIYLEWFKKTSKFLPVIFYSMRDSKMDIDKDLYGITTISFDDLKSFYSETYELILEMICIPIGLNNIIERKDYNKFYKDSNAKNFDEFFKLVKSKRIDSISEDESFSRKIFINRHIRNSISHFDFEIDKNNQLVIFHDSNRGKVVDEKMYFLDLGLLCFENVKIICYLNELLYSISKINYLNQGLRPNIKW